MFEALRRAYLDLFGEYPALVRLAIVTGLGQLAFALLNNCALPLYLAHQGVEAASIGIVATTFLVSEMLLKFPMGRLSDRIGRKPLVVIGPLAVSLNPILFAHIPGHLWRLCLPLRALDGAGAAALWPPLYAMVGDLIRSARRAAAMSIVNGFYAVGGGAAFVVGPQIGKYFESDVAPFYVSTILLLGTAAVARFGLPGVPRTGVSDEIPSTETGPILAAAVIDEQHEGHIRYPLWLVLSLTFLMSFGVLSLPPFLLLYLERPRATGAMGLSPDQITWLILGLAVPVALLALPLGHAADRWGREIAVRIALCAAALSMWLLPLCQSIWWLGGAALLLVIGYLTCTPAWLAIITDLAPTSRRGHMLSLVATAEGAGAALGPTMAGLLWGANAKLLSSRWLSWLGLSNLLDGYFLKQHPSHIFYGSAVVLTLCAALAVVTLRGGRSSPARQETGALA